MHRAKIRVQRRKNCTPDQTHPLAVRYEGVDYPLMCRDERDCLIAANAMAHALPRFVNTEIIWEDGLEAPK